MHPLRYFRKRFSLRQITVKVTIFWEVTGHCLLEANRCFRGAYCSLHQGRGARDHQQTEQKPWCFVEEGNILLWLMDSLHFVTLINYETLLWLQSRDLISALAIGTKIGTTFQYFVDIKWEERYIWDSLFRKGLRDLQHTTAMELPPPAPKRILSNPYRILK
jgi:hypothetical protein